MASSKCFVSVLVLSACLSLGCSQTIYVDLENGLDVEECLDGTLLPCKTLNYAYHGRNVSADDAFYDDLAIPRETASSHVTFLIMPGVYINDPPLVVLNSTNITFAASESGTVTIRCARFPNFGDQGYGPSGNYTFDDVNIQDSSDVSLRGIIFEKCGNFNSAVHVRRVEGLSVKDCIFRDATGTALQVRDCSGVTLEGTTFADNIDQRERHLPRQSNLAIDVLVLLEQVLLGGAFTFFSSGQDNVSLTIRNCTFEHNHGESISDVDSPVILRESGHGGGLLVQFLNTTNSLFLIEECMFQNNTADVDGGGVYMSLSDSSRDNTIVIRNTVFRDNSASEASGGAVSFNSYQVSSSNMIEISDSRFEANNASAGGAVSFVLYQSDPELPQDNLVFRNCVFVENTAENDGTAVGLFSLLHVDEFGFPVLFEDCEFVDNLSKDQNIDTSALAAFRFPITLNGTNVFRNNSGGAMTLLNTQMDAYGHVIMDSNRAAFGGGLAMDDRCLLRLHDGIDMVFINNSATESGAGIYVDFPPIRFVIEFFNRLCFIQYFDGSGQDLPPQNWNASIRFINNTARLSGAAIYASDLHGCSWLKDISNVSSIFSDSYDNSPFSYSGNTVSDDSNVSNARLATSPLGITAKAEFYRVQPGERVSISLSAKDQLENFREAVWSLERPGVDTTVLGALPAREDQYVYTVPSLADLGRNGTTACFTITLTFSLLRTLAQVTTVELTVVPLCHPGYQYSGTTCALLTDRMEILRDSSNNRDVFIREGSYMWPIGAPASNGSTGSNKVAIQITLPSYLECHPEGRLSGCRYKVDDPSQQCQEQREGIMCGECRSGYSVSLDLQTCQANGDCWKGLVVFLVLCVSVVVASFLIMFFNVRLPNELKGFLFYAQVIGLVFRQFESIRSESSDSGDNGAIDFARTVSNLLGFSLPIPLCIGENLEAHWVVLLSFVSPVLALATIIIYAIAARYVSLLSNRTALDGILFLLLFIYKYVADTSFLLASCVRTDDEKYRFFYNGNKLCTDADFLPFHIMSLLLLVGVFIAPFFLATIPYKFYGKFKQFSDVLTDGLRGKYRWWGGWDLGRRLVFVAVSFMGLFTRPSLVLFLLAVTSLIILTLHCFTKPYAERYINIIETLILLDLLLIVGLFIDPDSQVPIGFSIFMLLLPYFYFLLYVLWSVGRFIYGKVKREEAPKFWDLVDMIGSRIRVVLKLDSKQVPPGSDNGDYRAYEDQTTGKRLSASEKPENENSVALDKEDKQFSQLRVPDFDD